MDHVHRLILPFVVLIVVHFDLEFRGVELGSSLCFVVFLLGIEEGAIRHLILAFL